MSAYQIMRLADAARSQRMLEQGINIRSRLATRMR